jgi:acetyl esterase/lipase
MMLISRTYWAGFPFSFRRTPKETRVESLTIRADDFRQFQALYFTPGKVPAPKVAVVCMHPRVDFSHHYTFPRLLEAGIGCLGASTRNPNNDLDTEHEEIVLDVAAAVKFLRQRRGVEKVILLGNSGGGSLSALFQAQARLPAASRLAVSPGGTPTRLAMAEMIPADGLILISVHRGQGKVLAECIDPSLPAAAEGIDPLATDPALDMYDPDNGFREPPEWSEYPEDFVRRYRQAQLERVRRLDTLARAMLERSAGAAERAGSSDFSQLPFAERQRVQRQQACDGVMVVHRTMANLHYVDRRLDPSGREYGSLLSERPDLMNLRSLGFARVVTPRAWLSTWSALSSNADLVKNLGGIAEPMLVVFAGRDKEIYPLTDARPIREAVVSADRTFIDFEQARHYFEPDFGETVSPDVEKLMDVVVDWIQQRFGP